MSISDKKTILDEAAEVTSGPRAESYGRPSDNHARTALIWTGILWGKLRPGCIITAEDVCLCNVGQKLSRQVHKPGRDNLVDGCGYLRNVEMIQEELERGVASAMLPSVGSFAGGSSSSPSFSDCSMMPSDDETSGTGKVEVG